MHASDSEVERPQSLSYARRNWIPFPRNGNPINPSTIWRWIRFGVLAPTGQRVKLEVIYVGRTPMVTRAACARFIDAVTEAHRNSQDRIVARDTARPEATRRKLEKVGLITMEPLHNGEA